MGKIPNHAIILGVLSFFAPISYAIAQEQFASSQIQAVKKLSDAAMTCSEISAEVSVLESKIAKEEAESTALQDQMFRAQEQFMSEAPTIGAGTSLANTLLGFLPGGDILSGMSAAAQAESQQRQMTKAASDLNTLAEKMTRIETTLSRSRQRHEHLVGLYISKACRNQ